MIWLTGVSRADLTVPQLGRAERQSPLLLLPRPNWLFLMRQADRELSHWRGPPDTWKWDPTDQHAGIEKEDWEGLGGWRSEKRGEGWGGRPTSCQRTEWQVKEGGWAAKLLQGPLSDKRRKAHLWWLQTLLSGLSLSFDRPTRTNPVLLRDYSPATRISRTLLIDLHLELLNLSLLQPKFKVPVFLIQIPLSITQFWF